MTQVTEENGLVKKRKAGSDWEPVVVSPIRRFPRL